VNIALIDQGIPVLATVFAPAKDALYFASAKGGSWRKLGGGNPERIFSATKSVGSPLTIVESRSHPSEALEKFLASQAVGKRIQVGSSLKFCLVADGTADVYPRFGPTMEWDVAAGDCVWRYSGREAPRSSSLIYNKPDLRNGDFVIGTGYRA
jgi:3'(2'), 5'-bisphosphate nucleotidase